MAFSEAANRDSKAALATRSVSSCSMARSEAVTRVSNACARRPVSSRISSSRPASELTFAASIPMRSSTACRLSWAASRNSVSLVATVSMLVASSVAWVAEWDAVSDI